MSWSLDGSPDIAHRSGGGGGGGGTSEGLSSFVVCFAFAFFFLASRSGSLIADQTWKKRMRSARILARYLSVEKAIYVLTAPHKDRPCCKGGGDELTDMQLEVVVANGLLNVRRKAINHVLHKVGADSEKAAIWQQLNGAHGNSGIGSRAWGVQRQASALSSYPPSSSSSCRQ